MRYCDNLESFIAILEESKYPESVWLAKNYTKADGIRDLRAILEEKVSLEGVIDYE